MPEKTVTGNAWSPEKQSLAPTKGGAGQEKITSIFLRAVWGLSVSMEALCSVSHGTQTSVAELTETVSRAAGQSSCQFPSLRRF